MKTGTTSININLLQPGHWYSTLVEVGANIFCLYHSVIMRVPDNIVLLDQGVLWSLGGPLGFHIPEGLVVSVLIMSKE